MEKYESLKNSFLGWKQEGVFLHWLQEIMDQVRAGMLALVEEQTEVKRQDKKMVEQVSELDETIQSMSEEMGRKVAVDEVAEKLGISEAQIADILKLAGEEIDSAEDE